MIKTKKCKHCGKPFTTNQNAQQYCSKSCQRKNAQKKAKPKLEQYTCAWCGVEFKSIRKRKYCCDRCRLKANGRLLSVPKKKAKAFVSIEEVARKSREMGISAGEYMTKYVYGKEGV